MFLGIFLVVKFIWLYKFIKTGNFILGIQLPRAPQEASSRSSRDQVVFSTPFTNVRMGEHAAQTPALATELANSPQCCGRHKKGPARGPGRFSLPLQTHAHPHTPTAQASLTLTKANPPLFASRVVGWVMRAWATPAAAFPRHHRSTK